MVVLPLRLTARARKSLMFQHAVPGLFLIVLGMESLLHGEAGHLWLDFTGIIAGLALLMALRFELKHKPRAQHSKVGWFEVLAGVVVILEGIHKLHPGRWFQPGSLTMLVGVLIILLGIFHHHIESLRRLTITDRGFALRPRLISSFHQSWAGVKDIDLVGTRLNVHHVAGLVRSVNLRRIENRNEVLERLQQKLTVLRAEEVVESTSE